MDNHLELLYNFIDALFEEYPTTLENYHPDSIKEFASDWLNDEKTEQIRSKNYDNFENTRGYEE